MYPSNPNKWSKHLAPWFTEECRSCKKAYILTRRKEGRDSTATKAALKAYREACIQGKYQFSKELPDMLKYRPKQFWGMINNKEKQAPDLDMQAFADYNQKLFYNPNLPATEFEATSDPPQTYILPDEL